MKNTELNKDNNNNKHFFKLIRVIKKLPNTEQSSKGKGKTHKSTDKISQQPENWGKKGYIRCEDLKYSFMF